jgi:hypothetical protein
MTPFERKSWFSWVFLGGRISIDEDNWQFEGAIEVKV